VDLGGVGALRDGEVVRAKVYGDPEKALEAAGLRRE
jgi:hypothetical protein